MKKTLIIVCHPNIELSQINQTWINRLKQSPDQFTVHHIDEYYLNREIDIEKEQKLIESHEHLVLQFPIYWFNCPPLLKQWLDQVLSYGWAYGKHGIKLKNKKIGLAISTGIRQEDYSNIGRYHYTLQEILRPFEMTIDYVGGNYQSFFACYGTHTSPDDMPSLLEASLQKSTQDYMNFLSTF